MPPARPQNRSETSVLPPAVAATAFLWAGQENHPRGVADVQTRHVCLKGYRQKKEQAEGKSEQTRAALC